MLGTLIREYLYFLTRFFPNLEEKSLLKIYL